MLAFFVCCFPFWWFFSCHIFLKCLGIAMSFKCNLSFLETVLRGSLRAEQCWYSPWFVSLSKHLKAVNKGKLPTCCTLSTVKRAGAYFRQSHPCWFWSEAAYTKNWVLIHRAPGWLTNSSEQWLLLHNIACWVLRLKCLGIFFFSPPLAFTENRLLRSGKHAIYSRWV